MVLKRTHRLRVRLLLFFAASLSVPIFLIGLVTVLTARRSLLESTMREQREVARRIGDRVSTHVETVRNSLSHVAARDRFLRGNAEARWASLQQLMDDYPSLLECAVVNPEGRESLKAVRRGRRVLRSLSLVNRAGRDEFRIAQGGFSYAGPVFFTKTVRSPQMFLSVPLRGQQEALLARLSLDSVWDLVSEVRVGRTGMAFMVDGKGNLLAHPDPERVLAHENVANRPGVLAVLRERFGESPIEADNLPIYPDENGRPSLLVHYRLVPLGWDVIVQVPVKEALAPVRSMQRRVLAVAVVLGGGLLFLGLILVRRSLDPLRKLQEGAQSLGRGDLKHRLALETQDEIQIVAEEFNKMAASLERLEQTKRDLTHMIVHDLKSPLAGVLGAIDYVTSGLLGPISEEQARILKVGAKSGHDLLRLIQNLLDIAKMEEGRLPLQQEAVEVKALAEACSESLDPGFRRGNRFVRVDAPKGLFVSADRDLLERVLTNLLSNALRHSPEGGEVLVGAAASGSDGGTALVWVKDRGQGIPREYLQSIFEKFSQVGPRQGRVGTGLGLTFCKLAVEAHGGRIWAESEAGQGSTFFLHLAAAPRPPAPPAARQPAEPAAPGQQLVLNV